MSKVKIQSTDKSIHGKTVGLPIDGKVSVSAEGIVEVSEQAAKLLLGAGAGWKTVEGESYEEDVTTEEAKNTSKAPLNPALNGQSATVVALTEKFSFKDMVRIAEEAEIEASKIKAANSKLKIANLLESELQEESIKALLEADEEEEETEEA